MKASPMLFSTPMVKALLAGRKTMTRRPVKCGIEIAGVATVEQWAGRLADNFAYRRPDEVQIQAKADQLRGRLHPFTDENGKLFALTCPYGRPGDLIWVRETWARYNIDQNSHDWAYKATVPEDWPEEGLWRPSIHMPRKANRLTLQITDVRVEQLQEISDEDAIREGVEPNCSLLNHDNCDHDEWIYYSGFPESHPADSPSESFRTLWQHINGPDSWQNNPWVWVISFDVIHKNVDQVLQEAAA